MKLLLRALCVTSVASVFALLPCRAQTPSLYAQSVQTALTPSTRGLEVLLLDLRTHETLADTFAHPDAPIPVGSLLKPFLALAYSRSHPGFPTVVCHGHPDRCWNPRGHGPMDLPNALANSCNAYFLALGRDLNQANIPYLPPPPPDSQPATLIGLDPDWPIAPRALLNAYAALLTESQTPVLAAIRTGMRGSAAYGTASHIGPHPGGVLAKTGTAPCVNTLDPPCRATGDGLLIAAFPATHPTLLLLVRKRATTGASTAASAGRILSLLEALHAE